jgi:hypothetical protein
MNTLLKYIFIIVITSSIILIKAEMTADNVLLAINCGGESYRDSKDIYYLEDSYVEGGQSSDFGSQFEIKNTHDQIVYQTERWSENDFTYSLPVPEGKYVLVLKFSEVYFNSANEKVFDINIGNRVIVKSLDIYSKVGKSTAFDEFIEFEIKNSKAYINGKIADNGYDSSSNTLKVVFKKAERDNPKINGIIVVKGTLQDTDYSHFKLQLEDMEKEKMEKERKQREIKKRNNLHYDFEEYEEDFVDVDIAKSKSPMSSPLLWFGVILVSFIAYSFFTKKSSAEEVDKDE